MPTNQAKNLSTREDHIKSLLHRWFKDDECVEIESLCENQEDLVNARRAIRELDLAALRRLRSELNEADSLAESKINGYSAKCRRNKKKKQPKSTIPSAPEMDENLELVRELVMDWFSTNTSVANFLKERGESRMRATVSRVIQTAGLQQIRKQHRDNPEVRELVADKIDQILLAPKPKPKRTQAAVSTKHRRRRKKSPQKATSRIENQNRQANKNNVNVLRFAPFEPVSMQLG